MTDKKYYRADEIGEELSKKAIMFLVNCPNMNVSDKNFFEKVAILPQMYEFVDYITDADIRQELERVRNEVKRIRSKMWEEK